MPSGRGRCDCCGSDSRAAIDIAICAGVGYRVIAERFGVGRGSVSRHAKSHLSSAQRAALLAAQKPTAIDADTLAETERANLLGHVVAQRARLLADADTARQLGDLTAAIRAETAIGASLVTAAKMVGRLTQTIDVRHSHVLLSEDYLRLRQAIVAALRPHAAAMRDVVAALQRLESDAARQINPPRKEPPAIDHEPPAVIDATPALAPCPVLPA
ncbi:hypothetical protein JQ615_01035 [Bradyrhizobium jicamae]|uniref:Uncharacterized protein n=1 Tax=Bradyrhizobium jicamae TaxID=280332 RepID=A0ABS5FB05_9BRAD|nr:hypothetical protein [Bradyrhizobium jicamae]MBR0793965.1 hypothetical protein [Bradyrhizobium jicamae]